MGICGPQKFAPLVGGYPTPATAGRLWHDERMLQLARASVGVSFGRPEAGRLVLALVQRDSRRESGSSPTARAVYRAWDQTETRRSRDAGQPRTVHQTLRLARGGGQRASRDHRSLAPNGLADLLAPEVQGGSATDSAGTAQPDSQDGCRESVMGRGDGLPMSCWSSSGSGSRRGRSASTCRSDRPVSRVAISAGPPS